MFDLSGKHPRPVDDSQLMRSLEAVGRDCVYGPFFGFISIEQFRTWVYKDEWLHSLDDEGYRISLMLANPRAVAVGFSQACIVREAMVPVKTVRCADYAALHE